MKDDDRGYRTETRVEIRWEPTLLTYIILGMMVAALFIIVLFGGH